MDLFAAIESARTFGAEPMAGPGRIAVFASSQPDAVPAWPNDLLALDELVIEQGEPLATVAVDANDAGRIRSFFQTFEGGARSQVPQEFEYQGAKYVVYFRDALPIEDEDGRVIREWPAPGPL